MLLGEDSGAVGPTQDSRDSPASCSKDTPLLSGPVGAEAGEGGRRKGRRKGVQGGIEKSP